MAVKESTMLPLGTTAPTFTLLDVVSNKNKSLNELRSNSDATVIMFICNHCPYVKHIRQGLIDFANDYIPQGVSIIAINSNDTENYPEDSPEKMKYEAEKYGYPFPYLFDETQYIAKAYKAACTPDLYLFNGDLKLVYRGQFDESRPASVVPVTGKSIRAALDAVLQGKPINGKQIPSIGCSIKWKK